LISYFHKRRDMSTAKPSRPMLIIALLSIYIFWGSTFLGVHFAIRGFPPFMLAGLRIILASLCFFIWALLAGERILPSKTQVKNAALTGILMLGLSNGLFCVALQTVSTGITALIISSMPVYCTLFARIWGSKTSFLEWCGIGMGIAGVAILNIGTTIEIDILGMMALFFSAACWAFASVLIMRVDMPKGKTASALQMLFGGTASFIFSFLLGEKIPTFLPWESLLGLAYLIFFGSIIGFNAYTYLLHHTRPALATSYAYVSPIVAITLGALVVGETVDAAILIAMGIILSGVGLIAWEQNRRLA
jgi:drug/metabolite transporter (DMT)-like permease